MAIPVEALGLVLVLEPDVPRVRFAHMLEIARTVSPITEGLNDADEVKAEVLSQIIINLPLTVLSSEAAMAVSFDQVMHDIVSWGWTTVSITEPIITHASGTHPVESHRTVLCIYDTGRTQLPALQKSCLCLRLLQS
jgi:hypothetical protein